MTTNEELITALEEGQCFGDCCWMREPGVRQRLIQGLRALPLLSDADDLLDGARSGMVDPALSRSWGQRRKRLRDRIAEVIEKVS